MSIDKQKLETFINQELIELATIVVDSEFNNGYATALNGIKQRIEAKHFDSNQGEAARLLSEINSHGPEGRNYTNAQYVAMRSESGRLRDALNKVGLYCAGTEFDNVSKFVLKALSSHVEEEYTGPSISSTRLMLDGESQ